MLNPADACRYARAGEQILLEGCRELVDRTPNVAEIFLTRANVSYGGNSSSWACHESYGYRTESPLADHFIPHAVSRIIYTGAGGFDNRSHALQFLISPRVSHIRSAISENSVKLVPAPSKVAPRGYGRPGQTRESSTAGGASGPGAGPAEGAPRAARAGAVPGAVAPGAAPIS